jgi:4-amino-4-deoxy-L-arabinose transferase-like glycosyltransferase
MPATRIVDPARARRTYRLVAALAALGFVLAACGHAFTTPVLTDGSFINAPDEAAHMGYVRVLAEQRRLPRRTDTADHTYEWHQPPLYYMTAALAWPGGPRTARLLGVLTGTATLALLYLGGCLLWRRSEAPACLMVVLAAGLPMRQAICASVGNDAATELWFTAAAVALLVAARTGLTPRWGVACGAAVVMATLTKASGLVLVAPLLATAAVAAGPTRRQRVIWLACAVATVAAGSGWWFARNAKLYGDATLTRVFAREFAGTARAADWIGKRPLRVDPASGSLVPGPPMTRAGYTALVADWTSRTFVAAFTSVRGAAIGMPLFLPQQLYVLAWLPLASAMLGWLLRPNAKTDDGPSLADAVVLGVLLAATAAAFAAFTWTYFQAQGRYLYPAMLPLTALVAGGLYRWAGEERAATAAIGCTALGAILTAALLFAGVIPAYG